MNFPIAIPTIPVKHRLEAITWALVAIAFVAGFGAGLFPRSQVITQTRTVNLSIQAQYGKPSASVAGAQISSSLQGLTCDVFQAAKVVICHP